MIPAANGMPTRLKVFTKGLSAAFSCIHGLIHKRMSNARALLILLCINPWMQLNAAESPFVKTFSLVGIPLAAGIINFVVLTSAASACNSGMFSTDADQTEGLHKRTFRRIQLHPRVNT